MVSLFTFFAPGVLYHGRICAFSLGSWQSAEKIHVVHLYMQTWESILFGLSIRLEEILCVCVRAQYCAKVFDTLLVLVQILFV